MPEALRGRVQVGPWHLVVVAVVVVLGLVVTCWWLVRGGASAAAEPVAMSSASPLATAEGTASAPPPESGALLTPSGTAPEAPTDPSASASEGGTVTVDVEGKVHKPGIAVLPTGSRVIDAIEAAGGAVARKHLAGLNLAAVLTDGQQIVVGGPPVPAAPAAGAAGGDAATDAAPGAVGAPGTLINLNTATQEQLETLPGVGPVTAQAILEWRSSNGGFTSVDELLEVDGIGPKTLEDITPHVTV